jgi:hypothetical protein
MFETLPKSKYANAMGYDPKFKEQETIDIMEAIKDAFLDGYSKNYIAKLLVDEMGFKALNAHALTGKVFTQIVNDKEKREEHMKEKNIARLERVYARAVDSGDLKNALSALDQLNKLTGLYKNKLELSTDEFEFHIGE